VAKRSRVRTNGVQANPALTLSPRHDPASGRGGLSAWDIACATFLASLLLWLVLPSLGPQSLYRDDAWQVLIARQRNWADVARFGVTAPGFGLLLSAWLAASGFSEAAAQVPSLVAGALGPPGLYLLARTIGLSRLAALLAGLLLAVTSSQVVESARVKPFTLDALFAIILSALVLAVLRDPARRGRWLALAGSGGLALLVSAQAALPAASGLMACLFAARRCSSSVRLWGTATVACFGVAMLSWYLIVVGSSGREALHEYWAQSFLPWDAGLRSMARAAVKITDAFFDHALNGIPFAWVLGVPLAGIGAVLGSRVLDADRTAVLVLPFIQAWLLNSAGRVPLGGGRIDLYLLPFLFVLLALPLEWLKARRPAFALALGYSAICIIVLAAVWQRQSRYPREDLRSLTASVEDLARPEDSIVVYPETSYPYAVYSRFQSRLEPDPLSMTGFTPVSNDARVDMLPGFQFGTGGPVFHRGERRCVELLKAAIARARRRGGAVWIVQSLLFPEDQLPELDETLRQSGFGHPRES